MSTAPQPPTTPQLCRHCRTPLPPQARTGRRRLYHEQCVSPARARAKVRMRRLRGAETREP
jgi:hypothetical protein